MNDPVCEAITRRRFLTGLGAAAGTIVVGGYAISAFTRNGVTPETPTTAMSMATTPIEAGAPTNRTLVLLEMGGGNDGLSMVVPHADGTYYDLRRTTAVTDPIDLDGSVGLHPNLGRLASRYQDGDVAIIEGVGYPNSDLSHFVSMATWWTAAPGFARSTGWLGRYLDYTVGFDYPLAGITIGPGPSQAMAGEASFAVSIENVSGLQPSLPDWIDDADELMAAWAGMVPAETDPGVFADVYRTIAQTSTARHELNDRLDGAEPAGRRRRQTFADQLALAARLIDSDTPPQVLYLHGIGDFDTHENQPQRHGQLMTDLDAAIDGFFASVAESGKADDVALVTASEFGRRARDNGSGTDHGTASTHLVMGASVSGGRFGSAPSLTRTDAAGNTRPTVDFRSVYASMLDEWLGVDADEILGANYERLGLVGAR